MKKITIKKETTRFHSILSYKKRKEFYHEKPVARVGMYSQFFGERV